MLKSRCIEKQTKTQGIFWALTLWQLGWRDCAMEFWAVDFIFPFKRPFTHYLGTVPWFHEFCKPRNFAATLCWVRRWGMESPTKLLLLCYCTKSEASLLQTDGADSKETESTWDPESSPTWVLRVLFQNPPRLGVWTRCLRRVRGKQCAVRESETSRQACVPFSNWVLTSFHLCLSCFSFLILCSARYIRYIPFCMGLYFFKLNLSMHVFVCVEKCICVQRYPRKQKCRVPMELELQTVVSHLAPELETELWSSGGAVCTLNHGTISLAPPHSIFLSTY